MFCWNASLVFSFVAMVSMIPLVEVFYPSLEQTPDSDRAAQLQLMFGIYNTVALLAPTPRKTAEDSPLFFFGVFVTACSLVAAVVYGFALHQWWFSCAAFLLLGSAKAAGIAEGFHSKVKQ